VSSLSGGGFMPLALSSKRRRLKGKKMDQSRRRRRKEKGDKSRVA
jgi:hypothetical protein